MIRVTLSDLAQADLRDIANYSAITWGEVRAMDYRDKLGSIMDRLADFPDRGRCQHSLGQHIRRLVYEFHVIVYEQVSDN